MKIYLVGGAVRDKLLGYPFHEHDWVVVGGTPEQLLAQGYQQVGKDFPVFLHPDSKEEYALARTERKNGRGYTGFSCYASPDVTLEQDLLRRDLTINAIAEDSDGNLIDPYGGQQDIQQKILRHVSPAFSEDPLRVLRVARFAARYAHLGFTVANETLQLMQAISDSGELHNLVAERVWKELESSLQEQSPQQFFAVLKQAHALAVLLPEFNDLGSNDFQVLQLASERNCSSSIRFALLCAALAPDVTQTLCQRIKIPNEFRDLAMLLSRHQQQCQQNFTAAEPLLDLLEALDPFRRPERFTDFLQCCTLINTVLDRNLKNTSQLNEAYQCCNRINAKQFADQGLKGKAIASALREQRITLISELLSHE
ncbi:multifunctional CCA tRNA nucleotidyl transferase/2'3'-cyclic phosphodiesterase/2'nucleotidase/phosphatase [Oceanicoccus sp. KOV_DT_Chl]|uniref:multifunctional CCA tRNA nucleotidyl transferase/2'3'-cyclic phosphodiesterase/2'nucleotidase/phosphatase n=1 Tax=Oceanicoccus sp. KOV_DT_Chl TaxID=1904639 RepID=UPI000C7B54EE|nr:multifunctional CCA tRNA nucleotidyl transferase/2'3'-cyclic phosphodiesterase/2'nucleotidase/phosphatase [Oceanicoccus sp. KOV_DT_Chl]